MASINDCLVEFRSLSSGQPYQRQKSALERQLTCFLTALTPLRTICLASSEDIGKFLISWDVAHSQTCSRKCVRADWRPVQFFPWSGSCGLFKIDRPGSLRKPHLPFVGEGIPEDHEGRSRQVRRLLWNRRFPRSSQSLRDFRSFKGENGPQRVALLRQ